MMVEKQLHASCARGALSLFGPVSNKRGSLQDPKVLNHPETQVVSRFDLGPDRFNKMR